MILLLEIAIPNYNFIRYALLFFILNLRTHVNLFKNHLIGALLILDRHPIPFAACLFYDIIFHSILNFIWVILTKINNNIDSLPLLQYLYMELNDYYSIYLQ